MLTFSTVICTYNRKSILEKCLESWSQSKYIPDQFIVVDATENAALYRSDVVRKFPLLFSRPNSEYILADKPSLTSQRNIGIQLLKTDIVCFADDDTFVSPDYVSKVLEVFQRDKRKTVGGLNGVAKGQFDNLSQKYFRLSKNYLRHHFGSFFQRIHVPKEYTRLFEPLAPELRQFSLIHIDRLWGANMSYRTELIHNLRFDENFKQYGLFEDVDLSVRVGKTHKLICRLDAEIFHDDSLGQSTRPNDYKYFLASWLHSAYIIEKLFPCAESRDAHRRLFRLVHFISKIGPRDLREKKFRSLGNQDLLDKAQHYIAEIQACHSHSELGEKFVQLQKEIASLAMST